MARELTLADLEAAGVTVEPWAAHEQRNHAALIAQRLKCGSVDSQTIRVFDRHFDRAEYLNELAGNARRFRQKHDL